MKCTVVQQLLQLYLDTTLNGPDSEAVESHLTQCAGCRSDFLGLERLVIAVENLPRMAAPPDLYSQVMVQVAKQPRRSRSGVVQHGATWGLVATFAVVGLVFVLQFGMELAADFPELALDDPFTLMDSLLMVVIGTELSLVVGAWLLLMAGTATFLQVVLRSHSSAPA